MTTRDCFVIKRIEIKKQIHFYKKKNVRFTYHIDRIEKNSQKLETEICAMHACATGGLSPQQSPHMGALLCPC